jgi:hypothetical protein
MAAITPHPAPAAEAARAPGAAASEPSSRASAVLAALLLAAVGYAAFASGATRSGDASWLQAGLATTALLAACMAAAGAGVRARTSRLGAAGLALLLGLALWTALSILWSEAPDRTWLQANRGLAYVLAAALGLVVGTSLPRALGRAALAGLVLAAAVALYALGGKVLPGLSLPGVLDLDHTALSPRLRAPLGYANALAFLVAAGIPLALVTWADRAGRAQPGSGALAAGLVCVCVLGMTYSRGGNLALACALAVLLALAAARGGLLAALGLLALCALPALAVAFSLDGLTEAGAPRDTRKDDGLVLLGVVAAATLALLAAAGPAGRTVAPRAGAPTWEGPRAGRRRRRAGPRWIAPGVAGALVPAAVARSRLRTAAWRARCPAPPTSLGRSGAARTQEPGHLLSTSSDNRWSWVGGGVGAGSDGPSAASAPARSPSPPGYRETTIPVGPARTPSRCSSWRRPGSSAPALRGRLRPAARRRLRAPARAARRPRAPGGRGARRRGLSPGSSTGSWSGTGTSRA